MPTYFMQIHAISSESGFGFESIHSEMSPQHNLGQCYLVSQSDIPPYQYANQSLSRVCRVNPVKATVLFRHLGTLLSTHI